MNATDPSHIIIESMPLPEASWIDILSGLLTPISGLLVPVIAVIMLYIAYQQYKIAWQQKEINKQRLKSEIYERRLSVYKAVQSYLTNIYEKGQTNYTRTLKFATNMPEAIFLFDSEIAKHIDDLYKNGIKMAALYEKLYPSDGSQGIPKGKERSKIAEEHSNLLDWFMPKYEETVMLFQRHMGLK